MSIPLLRNDSLGLILLPLVTLLIVLSTTSYIILLGNYRQLEETQTRRNLDRVRDALTSELDNLENVVNDWATWNDTYAYIEDQNSEYQTSNLIPTTFTELRINLLVIIHRNGQLAYAGHFDRNTAAERDFPETLRKRLPELLGRPDLEGTIRGILLLPSEPLLFAARPILTSERQGPARGTLLMGRLLDAEEVHRIGGITHLTLDLFRYDDPQLPPRLQRAKSQLSDTSASLIAPLDKKRIAGYSQLTDIFGDPALLLQVSMPREIYLQGKKSVVYFMGSLIFIGLGAAILTHWLVGKLVLSHKRQERSEQRLAYLATHHPGTGLANRTLLLDRLRQALAYAWRHNLMVAILQLDLDNFKVINDSLGHTVGDLLLKAVAERFTLNSRAEDTIAHLGGDDFIFLLPDLHEAQSVAAIAQKFLDALKTPFVVAEQELFITASIGITIAPPDGENAETLLKNAEIALYQAKSQGRNTYQFFAREMNTRTMARLTMEADMRRALEREEFILYYQPRVDVSSGRLNGMEALVRWQHPERGIMSPLEFIPLAEETGLILPLGDWVLRTACAQHRIWQQAGLTDLRISVNLSARQLRQPDLNERIGQILAETGVDPRDLELEITESILMEDVESTLRILAGLREAGITLAMDDFGTGYSSLAYLKRFPLDLIKIDWSFVRDLTRNANDAALVRTIIAMAHNLNLRSVAEGVETEAQLAFLRRHGCDTAQGYYFSPPVPADEFIKIFRTYCAVSAAQEASPTLPAPKNPQLETT